MRAPQKQPEKDRLWRNDGSLVWPEPEPPNSVPLSGSCRATTQTQHALGFPNLARTTVWRARDVFSRSRFGTRAQAWVNCTVTLSPGAVSANVICAPCLSAMLLTSVSPSPLPALLRAASAR